MEIIVSDDEDVRHGSLDAVCVAASLVDLEEACRALHRFWRATENLYHRVRALLFLAAIHRYYLPRRLDEAAQSPIPFASYEHLLQRRFVEAIEGLLQQQAASGQSIGLSSALSCAYHELAFQTLADQVRRSVRTVRGNRWMFRTGHPADHPLRILDQLRRRLAPHPVFPVLAESTAVRMDFSHSGWSDIFFLGMDFPEGARVMNASINLAVRGRDEVPRPPIECFLRVIDRPVLRLVSVDLKSMAEISSIAEVFDFARDYLGLLKAAVIASGIVPPGMEGCELPMASLLTRLVGPGLGLEIVSKVNDIPKGSRLAVSTNLLGSLIALCMRATGQVSTLEGALTESDRRMIAARAILGEWLGGSGGGWQDSGGVWPGIKMICGAAAGEEDPEFGVSRGRLLPQHSVFSDKQIRPETRQRLQESLVLVHGGMAQNVGPILEMVTEKYLLRTPAAWQARQEAIAILDEIAAALERGDIRAVGAATHRNFFGPLQKIIPWCTNQFTQSLIEQAEARYESQFWGFWMLGGMSGGGMGFIFDPAIKPQAQEWIAQALVETKRAMQSQLPFAMEPVVYDFQINDRGTWAELNGDGDRPQMPDAYYALVAPHWLKRPASELSPATLHELQTLGESYRRTTGRRWHRLVESLLPASHEDTSEDVILDEVLHRFGFDRELHAQVQTDLRSGRCGLPQNRLPATTRIEDVEASDVVDARSGMSPSAIRAGQEAVRAGQVAVMTLAAGVGSRWTEGAGVVKALHPFCRLGERHRTFLEVHLAKSRRVGEALGTPFPHIVTTGYLTDRPIREHLDAVRRYDYPHEVYVSSGQYVGLRMVPMVRDLQFAWEEMPQQVLDEQQQKMRTSVRGALTQWAQSQGEGSDYRDNQPLQCLHPVGHWYEFPNLLRNGTLRQMLERQPTLKYLMLHNVDTLGASVDPGLLGQHIERGSTLSFEVIPRRLEDRGGGLARVNGRVQLLEGLAIPREQDEFRLTYYNTQTTWIDVDQLLRVFGLDRETLAHPQTVNAGIKRLSLRMPTYITIKDVKKRWGNGQEDIYPVSQFEKLWSDLSGLDEVSTQFLVVPLRRGQQLKDPAQLDGWLRDGSAEHVATLCGF